VFCHQFDSILAVRTVKKLSKQRLHAKHTFVTGGGSMRHPKPLRQADELTQLFDKSPKLEPEQKSKSQSKNKRPLSGYPVILYHALLKVIPKVKE